MIVDPNQKPSPNLLTTVLSSTAKVDSLIGDIEKPTIDVLILYEHPDVEYFKSVAQYIGIINSVEKFRQFTSEEIFKEKPLKIMAVTLKITSKTLSIASLLLPKIVVTPTIQTIVKSAKAASKIFLGSSLAMNAGNIIKSGYESEKERTISNSLSLIGISAGIYLIAVPLISQQAPSSLISFTASAVTSVLFIKEVSGYVTSAVSWFFSSDKPQSDKPMIEPDLEMGLPDNST